MLMVGLMLLRMLIKNALKEHAYGDFKQHKRGIIGINIGLSLNENSNI